MRAAQLYYELLEGKDKGIEQIPIYTKELTPFGITLRTNIRLWSGNLIIIHDDKRWEVGGDEVDVESYDEKSGVIKLLCDCELAQLFMNENITLCSDLKFLVRNVEEFFIKYGERVRAPSDSARRIPTELDRLSQEQQSAVKMIFSHPLSYTWGAPGSGKTKGVLFESLLFAITQGVRTFLLAPTNNALEQALVALISKFDELGLDRGTIFRIGVPSVKFLEKYPEVCDLFALNKNNEATLFNNPRDERAERLKNSLLLAMTVDSFIKRFDTLPKHGQNHIFLDEAAFVPLIKTLTLCVLDAPISMLGDHKQLPPVCEANGDELIKEPLLNAWQYSALYINEYLHKGADIFSSKPQDFHLPQSNLTYSYRYGGNLTRILDEYVYGVGLQGLEESTALYYVDSGYFREVGAHVSENEARKIKEILAHLDTDDVGIITPFVKQKRAILEYLPELYRKDCVMTIHGSQGREFDTVIFSPVTLHYHLTNSQNPLAQNALNVAISRARRRIIFVCDYRFWCMKQGQFITALLRESSALELGNP